MDPFDFQAPQFYERLDLMVNNTDDGADEFFAFNPNFESILPNGGDNENLNENRPILNAKRRSTGVRPQTDNMREKLKKDMEKLTFDGIRLDSKTPEKKHAMLTRNDVNVKTPKIELRNRNIRRETLKRCATENKYSTFAESVYNYQHNIPPRFKSNRRNFVSSTKLGFPQTSQASQKSEQSKVFIFKAEPSLTDRQSIISTRQNAVQPFSFDERDKLRKIKKEEKIQKIIMKETKIPDFHARPPPSFISNITKDVVKSKCVSMASIFKASEATVLSKEPFVPKKMLRPLTEPIELKLKTEKRAHERAHFDNYLKEINVQNEILKKEREEQLKLMEQEKIAQLRNELVHKPMPLPKFYKS